MMLRDYASYALKSGDNVVTLQSKATKNYHSEKVRKSTKRQTKGNNAMKGLLEKQGKALTHTSAGQRPSLGRAPVCKPFNLERYRGVPYFELLEIAEDEQDLEKRKALFELSNEILAERFAKYVSTEGQKRSP